MSAAMDSQTAPVVCEVCGTYFETRRGLSSHARLHLRQLGVTLSDSSGAPIELLYELMAKRGGSLPELKADSSTPETNALKKTSQQESRTRSALEDKIPSYSPGVRVMTTKHKTDHQGSPVRYKESVAAALPSSPPSSQRLSEGSSSSSSEPQTPTKPLWAPRETDAPISLASETTEEVHVCQLCGCWYETRKGLSSHARAHLRQIGIPDSDIKGSAIDFLYRIMEEEDLKPTKDERNAPGSSSKRFTELASSAAAPPSKRPKTSEDFVCIMCGEDFENRKGLASHCRSHLRQMGVTDVMGKGSAIDTLQELVRSGMIETMQPPKAPTASGSSAAASATPTRPRSPASSPTLSPSQSPIMSIHSPPPQVSKAPKAKKGFRLAVDPLLRKPKPEPVEVEVSLPLETSDILGSSSAKKSPHDPAASKTVSTDAQSPPTVLCDFCGQLFDTRKALSCHARAHLRQLGLTWSIKSSPIDLLREVMLHGEEGQKEFAASGKATWTPQGSKRPLERPQSREPASNSCSSPLDYSIREKSPSAKSGLSFPDTSCELCGFHFENRKALASHARAHLRQLGIIEWKADGATSPIELLSDLIRRDPVKVASITRRYRSGDLYIKKSHRPSGSPTQFTDSDYVLGGSLKQEHSSRATQGHTRTMAGHGNPGVRSPRGVHPPKHSLPRGQGSQKTNSQQPPRSGSIPAMLPKPPLTPLVKLVGKIYSLKCRFCEEVFQGPLSVQERWVTHLQKHILSLGYKGKESPPTAAVAAPALVDPVAV